MVRLLERLREQLSPRGLELFQRLIVDDEPIEALVTATGLTRDALYQWRSRLVKLVRQLAAEENAPVMSETGSPPRTSKTGSQG
jgi:hypothetical protein